MPFGQWKSLRGRWPTSTWADDRACAHFPANWQLSPRPGSARARGRLDEVTPSLFVKRLGSQIDAVLPGDRPWFGIDPDSREVLRVAKGRQHAAALARREIDITNGSVLGSQVQAVLADDLDRGYVQKLLHQSDAAKSERFPAPLGGPPNRN